jgi:hypothetical protein
MGSVISLMNIIEINDNTTINNKKAKPKLHILSPCLSKNKNNITEKSCNVPWKYNEEYIT